MPSERIQRQIDALLDEAEAAIRRSDWDVVRDRARNALALALDPDNADARHYRASADRALSDGGGGTQSPLTPALSQREREPESAT